MLRRIIIIIISLAANAVQAHTDDQCMASAIFYEANLESIEGQVAVFEVITNRAETYSMTVCQVVKQKGQFSWYPSKPIKKYNKEMKDLLTLVKSESKVLNDERVLWFYDKRLRPKWAKRMQCRVIGGHRFCKIR